MIPDDLRYTDQHEWIRPGDQAVVGISEHAQKSLGDLTFIELPNVGATLKKGDEACAVESCKAAASIYAPVSGKVVAVNEALNDEPGLVNTDCYGEGWIFKIAPSDPAEIETLLTPEKYRELLGE
jgi:glycine cleavage system H protein